MIYEANIGTVDENGAVVLVRDVAFSVWRLGILRWNGQDDVLEDAVEVSEEFAQAWIKEFGGR